MPIKTYQKQVDDFFKGYEDPYWTPHEILARITEEVGELARLINHTYGPKPKKASEAAQDMGEEMADILFALICLANREGIDLDEQIAKVIHKAKTRDKDRFPKRASTA